MRLSEFIVQDMERILEEWEAFARTIRGTGTMSQEDLRDHARAILTRIAQDMAQPQSGAAQKEKSRGEAPDAKGESAAEEHATHRESQGFGMNELVSEYRALRATVIRLWVERHPVIDDRGGEELTRFNEGIDQAVAESVARFGEHVNRSRDLFLAILGHDLRNPLGAIVNSAAYLAETEPLADGPRRAVAAIRRSAKRLEEMIGDLLDVARTRLGQSLPIEPEDMDLAALCEQISQEAMAHHSGAVVTVTTSGGAGGRWDRGRLSQLVSNLVGNAIEHGARGKPIAIAIRGDVDMVTLTVHNAGDPIPGHLLPRIFEPGRRNDDAKARPAKALDSLGLGLYICCQVVKAHGGRLSVDSSIERGTTFTARLPRIAS